MDEIINQINFDLLTCQFLHRIDASISPRNIEKARKLFKNDSDSLLDTILDIDEIRKASGKDHVVFITKLKNVKTR